jgi:predicted dehydrogenase
MSQSIGIAMNGVTGRMGTNQHLMRSLVAIRAEGGLRLANGSRLIIEPLLLGRTPEKLAALASQAGGLRWTTSLDEALSDPSISMYFDAQTTKLRYASVKAAIAAGKHVYCEKPSGATLAEALDLYHQAKAAGVKHGVVQDKLWLPGILQLRRLIADGTIGKILGVRGEFGYWVFTGSPSGDGTPQRPSWNYRKEDGGGIIADMLCHWRYVLDNVVAPVRAVSCLGATHIDRRWNERGEPYEATADDAAYATCELEGGIVAQFNSSWCTRVRRDDLLTIQVDGTNGSAVAGLRECWRQRSVETPRPVWNPDVASPIDFYDAWDLAERGTHYPNAFRAQWELFLRHVVANEPFPWDLREGAKGVQLADLGLESWKRRAWVDVPELAP